MLITDEGVVIRFEARDISITGRNTQGVRLMRLDEEHFISTLCIVDPADIEAAENANAATDSDEERTVDDEDEDIPEEVEELIKRAEDEDDEDEIEE